MLYQKCSKILNTINLNRMLHWFFFCSIIINSYWFFIGNIQTHMILFCANSTHNYYHTIIIKIIIIIENDDVIQWKSTSCNVEYIRWYTSILYLCNNMGTSKALYIYIFTRNNNQTTIKIEIIRFTNTMLIFKLCNGTYIIL